jgi:hypothetical protein
LFFTRPDTNADTRSRNPPSNNNNNTTQNARSLFGWTPSNEIFNGRWVMFGVFVGLLTEYATGVSFPNQIGLLLTYLGIVDTE